MITWLFLGAAIVSEVTGSLALKAALDHPGWYALVVIGYLAAFVLLDRVLRRGLPLGVAYGIWGALGVALTAVMSSVLFGETVTVLMAVGMVLVIGGVLCIELGSGARTEKPVGPS
ncbi:SMR family transporter [Williamsia sp.]|uniref:DMT family transporter n=1 Tax=Williamsia sp. TaxID=1872085 RepID=UPI001A1A54A4|nr:SMR family transporter [Williamsia sp.]MBJ7288859.1 QacE family quaternary ammonium compound efflux SMR transporter [Williamsia sp.]